MRTVSNVPQTATKFLYRLFHEVLPLARNEISRWKNFACAIPDQTLRLQALASLSEKRFHADGGCVYAAVSPYFMQDLVRVIVALQTISDYLDNLCDRCQTYNQDDFHQLHHAMRDAVKIDDSLHEYYQFRPNVDDAGYLRSLVEECRTVLKHLPNYRTVEPHISWLVDRYCELQELKHIEPEKRTSVLMTWAKPYCQIYPELNWWEFAAATGSTLSIFALILAATGPISDTEAVQIREIYFPWIGGLHILLDYLIDLEEDKQEGDFNFIRCYKNARIARAQIHQFALRSWEHSKRPIQGGGIHRFVVKGLLGMYLSDHKVRRQKQVRPARRLVWRFGPTAWLFYLSCILYRVIR